MRSVSDGAVFEKIAGMIGIMPDEDSQNAPLNDRYSRQTRFPHIGDEGQQKIGASTVLLIGCGALGSVIADSLVRAGVGTLRLVDRDFLELSNLQRQTLFDEEDVAGGLPKSIAAANRLAKINSNVKIEPHVMDVDSGNIASLVDGVDLILDGSDNFEIRFLINDASIKWNIPWIYGGCLGADGQAMVILPGETACLNCLMMDGPPAPGTTATCDSFGILAPIINVIGSFQVMEALKILSGNPDAINRKLNVFEMWTNDFRQLDMSRLRESVDCPTCKQQKFQWLSGDRESQSAILCGRNAVQINPQQKASLSLPELAERLERAGRVETNKFLLRFFVDDFKVTVFPDGRAIISGTDELATAKKIYAQYIGA